MALTNKMIGMGASGTPAYLRSGDGALIQANVQHLTDANGVDLGPVSASNGVPFANSAATPVTATWTSATTLNTALTINTNTLGCIAVTVVTAGSMSAGVLTFEAYDGAAWIPVRIGRFDINQSNATFSLPSAVAGTYYPWGDAISPYSQYRVRLSTAIVGGGSASIAVLNNSANVGTTSTVAIDSGYNQVQLIPGTAYGLSQYSAISTGAVLSPNIKNTAGQVYSMELHNNQAATVAYARLYNKSTAPGSGDTPVWRGMIPPLANGGVLNIDWPNGVSFPLGIGLRISGAIADNDTTVLTANTILANVEYF